MPGHTPGREAGHEWKYELGRELKCFFMLNSPLPLLLPARAKRSIITGFAAGFKGQEGAAGQFESSA